MASRTRLGDQRALRKGNRSLGSKAPRILPLEADLMLGFEGQVWQGLPRLRRAKSAEGTGALALRDLWEGGKRPCTWI